MAGDDPPAFRLMHGMQALLRAQVDATKMYASGPVAYRQFSMEGRRCPTLLTRWACCLTHGGRAKRCLRTLGGPTSPQREAVTARLLGAALAVDAVADHFPRRHHGRPLGDLGRRDGRRPAHAEASPARRHADAVVELAPLPATGLWQARAPAPSPREPLPRLPRLHALPRPVEPTGRTATSSTASPRGTARSTSPSRAPSTARSPTPKLAEPRHRGRQPARWGASSTSSTTSAARGCATRTTPPPASTSTSRSSTRPPRSPGIPGAGDISPVRARGDPDAATFFLPHGRGRRARHDAGQPSPARGAPSPTSRAASGLNLDPTLDGIVSPSQSEIQAASARSLPLRGGADGLHPSPSRVRLRPARPGGDPPPAPGVTPSARRPQASPRHPLRVGSYFLLLRPPHRLPPSPARPLPAGTATPPTASSTRGGP